MPVTVNDLISSSFRLIGAIAAGETLETNELNDAFISLNQMIASWNTEGLSIAGRKRLLINVSSVTGAYVLPERPVKIESASVASSGIDSAPEIVDSTGWEAITEKNTLAIITRKLYCDYGYPTATVYIWPVPRTFGQLELWVYQAIAPFASLSQIIDLPPGYEVALRFNLAVLLEPEYPRSQMDAAVPAQAQNYKASLVQLNASNQASSKNNSPQQAAAAEAAQTQAG